MIPFPALAPTTSPAPPEDLVLEEPELLQPYILVDPCDLAFHWNSLVGLTKIYEEPNMLGPHVPLVLVVEEHL